MPSAAVTRLVRDQAAGRCEYCRFTQASTRLTFAIDHIVARQHGGADTEDNLAVACGFCNSRKGPNLSGMDSVSRRMTRLFHPRSDRWADHFEWVGLTIVGRTDVGRTTVAVLAMNESVQIVRRRRAAADGTFAAAD